MELFHYLCIQKQLFLCITQKHAQKSQKLVQEEEECLKI